MSPTKPKNLCESVTEWEWEAWSECLGSVPTTLICKEDYAQSYEVCDASVYQLANKKYALITQYGCSCYESRDADIDLFPTKALAMKSFANWKKANKRD